MLCTQNFGIVSEHITKNGYDDSVNTKATSLVAS